MSRHRRGFTLLELVAALVIVMTIVAIALPTYKALKGQSSDSSVTMRLAALELEVDRVAVNYPGAALPANIEQFLRAAGVSFTASPSDAATRISVAVDPGDPDRAVLAALAPSNTCFVAITSPDSNIVWAADDNVAKYKCRASLAPTGVISGTRENPTSITLA